MLKIHSMKIESAIQCCQVHGHHIVINFESPNLTLMLIYKLNLAIQKFQVHQKDFIELMFWDNYPFPIL